MAASRPHTTIPECPDLVNHDIQTWGDLLTGVRDPLLRKAARRLVVNDPRFASVDVAAYHIDQLLAATYHEERMLVTFILGEYVKKSWNDRLAQYALVIAADSDWAVREGAQLMLKAALLSRFDDVIGMIEQWAGHENPNVRRAVLLACRPTPRLRLCQIEQRLDVIERLLDDSDPYVMRNIPYALGFFRHYPELLLTCLKRWAERPQLRVRKSIALVCAGGLSRTHSEQVLEILQCLVSDQRKPVQRAVVKAMDAASKTHPELVADLR